MESDSGSSDETFEFHTGCSPQKEQSATEESNADSKQPSVSRKLELHAPQIEQPTEEDTLRSQPVQEETEEQRRKA